MNRPGTTGVVAAVVWACLAGLGAFAASAPGYRLGPQDQLQIRVYDLRTGTGEAYQWTAFNGDFTVGASGAVSLPLVGELPANDKTTADLAAAIAEKLQAKVGLAQRPDASVEVIKYRPFYAMGSVDKPGEYEFRPNLTVLQAVSMAGGLQRVPDDALLGYVRDAVSSRGDLRVLTVDRLALLARQARLDAEIKGADAIVNPPEVQSRLAEPDVARLVREEQMLFESRRYSLRSQTEALELSKTQLGQQIDAMQAKDASLKHQLDIIRKELDQVTGLVNKGLAVLPRQLEVEQSSAQFESSRLDIQLAILKAQQDQTKADRDILELRNTRTNESLQEATEVRSKLAETQEKIDTTQTLILQSQARTPLTMSGNALATPDYFIVRRIDGQSRTQIVQEGDLVQPGDVVRVEPKQRVVDPQAGLKSGQATAPAPHLASEE